VPGTPCIRNVYSVDLYLANPHNRGQQQSGEAHTAGGVYRIAGGSPVLSHGDLHGRHPGNRGAAKQCKTVVNTVADTGEMKKYELIRIER